MILWSYESCKEYLILNALIITIKENGNEAAILGVTSRLLCGNILILNARLKYPNVDLFF